MDNAINQLFLIFKGGKKMKQKFGTTLGNEGNVFSLANMNTAATMMQATRTNMTMANGVANNMNEGTLTNP
ncbi:hypothetical protein K8R62_04125 [bacterium]|nr:hypothetical protein [bacterium]